MSKRIGVSFTCALVGTLSWVGGVCHADEPTGGGSGWSTFSQKDIQPGERAPLDTGLPGRVQATTGGIFIFYDQLEFEDFNISEGKELKGFEDFEPPVSNLAAGDFAALADPLLGNVPNVDPASGLGFPNGLLNKNLAIQSNGLGANAPQIQPGAGLVALGQGFVTPPDVPNSVVVGSQSFADSTDLIFDPDENHTGVGFNVIDPISAGGPEGGVIHVTVFNKNNEEIFKDIIGATADKQFWGIWSPDTIGRVNLAGLGNDGSTGGELVDNIQMWLDGPSCPGEGNCFVANGTPGCEDFDCCEAVCAIDPFCCVNQWDQLCADEAQQLCGNPVCPSPGNCGIPHNTPGCEDAICCKKVCQIDPFCCEQQWDALCADEAINLVGCAQEKEACCFPDGSCSDLPVADCSAAGGVPQGPGVFCADVICLLPCCDGSETPEGEPCGADTNGGCNSTPTMYDKVQCFTVICGNAWADGGTRDTDWYRVSLPNGGDISATLESQFDGVVFIVDGIGPNDGSPCPGPVVAGVTGASIDCIPGTASAAGLPPGDYVVFVATAVFEGTPCGTNNEYRLTIDCVLPPKEACCFPDTSCVDTLPSTCVDQGGTPQGPGSVCVPGLCPLPTDCTVFDNQAEFEIFNIKDGKTLKGFEDFEQGIVPPGTFADLADPLLGNVPNVDPASGLGFPTGLINKNLAIQSNSLGENADVISPGAGLRALGQGFVLPGPPPVPNSIVVGTRYPQGGLPGEPADSLDLIFDPDSNHTGIGFDVIDPTSPPRIIFVTVFDKNNGVIFKGAVPEVLNEKTFFGIWCPDGIGRINLAGESGPGANNGAEYVDNIQMWQEPNCPGEGNCFVPNDTPGCENFDCCEAVCSIDPFCCQQVWDALCADEAQQLCGFAVCGGGGSCFIPHPTPGCNIEVCCKKVCLLDPFCCEQQWDALCVDEATTICDGCLGDTNFDNVVNVVDLVNVILLWGSDGNAPGVKADINKDGIVDVQDLVLVILAWGPCP